MAESLRTEISPNAGNSAINLAETLLRKLRLVIPGWTSLQMQAWRLLAMTHAAAGDLPRGAKFANDMQRLINEMPDGQIGPCFKQRDWSLDRQKCAISSVFRRPDNDNLYPNFRHMAALVTQRDTETRDIDRCIILFAIMGALESFTGDQDRSESWLEGAQQLIRTYTLSDLVSEVRLTLLAEASSMYRTMRVFDNDSARYGAAVRGCDRLMKIDFQSALDTEVCEAVALFCRSYQYLLHYKQSNHTLGHPYFAQDSSAWAMQALEDGGISPTSRIYKEVLWGLSRAQYYSSKTLEGEQAVAVFDLASHGYREAEGAPDDYGDLDPVAIDIRRTIDATTYSLTRSTDSRLFVDAFHWCWRGVTRNEFVLPDFSRRFKHRAWALIQRYKTASIYTSIVHPSW
ncbi:hypothetical protein BDW69DRAFT_186859 [Aspergillus filifer]